MTHSLDQWHEIHDAYVTFFGDDHRPAAVRTADLGDQRHTELDLRPGSVLHVQSANHVQILNSTYGTFNSGAYRRDTDDRIFRVGDSITFAVQAEQEEAAMSDIITVADIIDAAYAGLITATEARVAIRLLNAVIGDPAEPDPNEQPPA